MAKNMMNSFQKRPMVLHNLAEHKHQVAATRHSSEHFNKTSEATGQAFLRSLATDRSAAKAATEKHKEP
jgi:hypothetical protein